MNDIIKNSGEYEDKIVTPYKNNLLYCDRCQNKIEKVSQGWVQWRNDENYQFYGFKITHHRPHSKLELKTENGCYFYHRRMANLRDLPLSSFYGTDGMGFLLGMVSEQLPNGLPRIKDNSEFLTLFMRLHLPYFEEASKHIDLKNEKDKQTSYMPGNLKFRLKSLGIEV
jgi:hypothetical protein